MRKRRGEIDALCSTLVDSVTLVYPCFLLHFDSVGNVGFLKSVMDRTNNSSTAAGATTRWQLQRRSWRGRLSKWRRRLLMIMRLISNDGQRRQMENASRPENLSPNQGGKYAGFGFSREPLPKTQSQCSKGV
ncbi:hypothetical protein ACLKA7_002766 [Drosophila subpalustris]